MFPSHSASDISIFSAFPQIKEVANLVSNFSHPIHQPNMERYVKDKIIKLSGYFIELLKMSRSMFYYLLSIHSLSRRLELMTAS